MSTQTIKLLLVEDNVSLTEILLKIFKQQEHPRFNVTHAGTLKETIEKLCDDPPDVVLLDLGLPDSRGLNTFTQVHGSSPKIPVVVMTAADDERMTVEAIRSGAQDYLVKGSFDAKVLPRILGFAIERKRAQQDVQLAEEKYRTIFENSAVAIFVADADERVVSWNKFAEDLLGMSADDLQSKPVKALYPEEDWKKIRSYEIRKKGNPHHIEAQMIRKNGSVIDVEVSITVLKDAEGKITGSIGITKDITERKMAQRALEFAEDRYRTIFENSAVAITVTDAEERIVSWNKFAENLLGMSHADLDHKPVNELYPEEEWKRIRAMNVRQKGIEHNLETKVVKKNGEMIDISISISILRDSEGRITGSIGIMKDITQGKRLEKQVQQAQKMEAVGRLAGGVAHDFNNLLTVIRFYSEFLILDLEEGDGRRREALQIKKAADRAAELTQQLLAFSRRQVVEPKIINLNDIILGMEKMLQRLIGENVELKIIRDSNLSYIKADPGQIEQIIVNLSVNAHDAMPQGGRLVIETGNQTIDNEKADQYGIKAGDYTCLRVRDSGIGMSEELKVHIFEPFFTTKEKGKGTGLGLATCYGIAKQNGGHIELTSAVDEGTTFDIYLPAVRDAVPEPAKTDDGGPLAQGTETVVLVEDQTPVRNVIRKALLKQGYKVYEATNGEEGLAVFENHKGEEIDLLMTDVIMPVMGGKEMYDQLKSMYPSMKVLFMSGYADDELVRREIRETGLAFIQKPFSLQKLAQKVREVIDQKTADKK